MNPIYRNHLGAKIAGALDEARAARAIAHDGVVGVLREIVIEQLIQPLLPSGMDVTSGVVTSHSGLQTGQCDLIVYDRASIPATLRSATGVVPIEATLAVIEANKSPAGKLSLDAPRSGSSVISAGSPADSPTISRCWTMKAGPRYNVRTTRNPWRQLQGFLIFGQR